ncbi:MAG: diacylglycerol kinase family protein [Dysgonamonadaceae bacterium]|jgi:diacylglycerol kinase|nr:diacylglycerol kinase family protein [Dysgonamonadaceae bacterium]
MVDEKFSIRKRLVSFKYAFSGLKILLKEEHNARIHLFIALFVLVAGIVFRISMYEWIVIFLCIGGVFALELINSAIENIADFVSPEKHETIKKIKDLSAAAVLTGAMISFIAGIIIFIPKIIALLC